MQIDLSIDDLVFFENMKERLQKFLAECGISSRRACEKYITDGLVTVNGVRAVLGMSVDDETDTVTFRGAVVKKQDTKKVLLFYKPRGVICSASDPEGRKTVLDYFQNYAVRLYNVGRLDLNSEGLLLLTNDGEFANRMMHPRYGIRKTYYCVCDGKLSASEAAMLSNGVELDDGITAPAKVENIRTTQKGDTAFQITIREGRNRQIRRMVEAIGHKTLRLKREKYGTLTLGELKPGEWRELNEKEVTDLLDLCIMKSMEL